MKRILMALCVLMLTSVAHAKLNLLDVHLAPNVSVYAKGDVISVAVTANGDDTQYRYVLERKVNGKDVLVTGTVWSSSPDYQIDTAAANIPAGKYRLLTMARENASRPETLARYELFYVIGADDPDFDKVVSQNIIFNNFLRARTVILEKVLGVREKLLLANQDLTVEFNNFQSAAALITHVINPTGRPAPAGGNAYVVGQGDAATGAVGVRVVPPRSPDNWDDMMITIDLPDYLGFETRSETGGDIVSLLTWGDVEYRGSQDL